MRNPFAPFAAAVRCGVVCGPYNNGAGRRLVWMWFAQGEDALTAADRLRPWLSAARFAARPRLPRRRL